MITIVILVFTLTTLYLYLTKDYKYWEVRGIKHEKPIVVFGNNAENYLFQKSISEVACDLYYKYNNEKTVGFYRGRTPEILVRDPEIIKRILISDFVSFSSRGLNYNNTLTEPLMKNVFFADGDLWQLLRRTLTPAFTSGKLLAMFPLITESAERLQARALDKAVQTKSLNARELMSRYTIDLIGTIGFGIDFASLEDDNSSFFLVSKKIFNFPLMDSLLIHAKEIFPKILKNKKILGHVESDILDLINSVVARRNNTASGRNDFIDLLLEAKQNGNLVGQSVEKFRSDGTPDIVEEGFDNTLIAAQALVFWAAGFETTSSASSYTLHYLAFNPEVQKKAQADVDKALAKHGGILNYDAINEMLYLEATLKEGLRVMPVVGYIMRQCVHDYTIPETGLHLTPGVSVIISLSGLHNDPKYFKNPNEFNPERFLTENTDPKHELVFKPFGEGPRHCIAARMAKMQSLAGLAAILSKFTVSPGPDTKRKLEIDPTSKIVTKAKTGVPLLFEKRKV